MIQRPLEEVFQWLVDPDLRQQWQRNFVGLEDPWVEPHVGASYCEMHQYGGQRFKIVTEILEWEPPRRLVSRSSGMSFEQVGVAALASTAGGTVLTFDVDARLTHKLFSPFVKRAIRSAHRRVNRDLLALKGLAEAETQGDDV